MTYDYVSVQRQGRVATVTFDRGNALNALSIQAIEELTDVARNLEHDLEISAVVLTTPRGAGFSAGRDLADPAADRRREDADAGASSCRRRGKAALCGLGVDRGNHHRRDRAVRNWWWPRTSRSRSILRVMGQSAHM